MAKQDVISGNLALYLTMQEGQQNENQATARYEVINKNPIIDQIRPGDLLMINTSDLKTIYVKITETEKGDEVMLKFELIDSVDDSNKGTITGKMNEAFGWNPLVYENGKAQTILSVAIVQETTAHGQINEMKPTVETPIEYGIPVEEIKFKELKINNVIAFEKDGTIYAFEVVSSSPLPTLFEIEPIKGQLHNIVGVNKFIRKQFASFKANKPKLEVGYSFKNITNLRLFQNTGHFNSADKKVMLNKSVGY